MLNTIGVLVAGFLLVATLVALWAGAIRAVATRRSIRSVLAIGALMVGSVGLLWVGFWLALPCGSAGCAIDEAVSVLRRRTIVLDRNGEPFGVLQEDVGPWRTLQSLPSYVPLSVVAAEDRRFWTHSGMDLRGVVRAVVRNVKGHREGASTIAFQVAQLALGKVGVRQLPTDGTLAGKLAELSIGWRLIERFGHEVVLEMYLNAVPLGPVYGYPAAARYFFGKDAADLSAGEAATLAAMIRRPSGHDPFRHPERARAERDRVLGIMTEVAGDPLGAFAGASNASLRTKRGPRSAGADYLARLRRTSGGRTVFSDTLRTTLDLGLEREARRQLQRVVREVEGGRFGPAGRGKSQLQAVYLAVDQRGEVRAYMAARPDAATVSFDRIVAGNIRLASTIKPFLYTALLERGLVRPTDVIRELEARVGGRLQSGWPGRLRRSSCLGCTLEEAIARSDNYAAYLMWELLPAAAHAGIVGMSRGVLASDPTAALGTGVISPMELALAYDRLITGWAGPAGGEADSTDGAALIVRRQVGAAMARALQEGTGKEAGRILGDHARAGLKTGTVDGVRELLLVGYHVSGPDTLVSVLWLGHDVPRMIAAYGTAGGVLAVPFARIVAGWESLGAGRDQETELAKAR